MIANVMARRAAAAGDRSPAAREIDSIDQRSPCAHRTSRSSSRARHTMRRRRTRRTRRSSRPGRSTCARRFVRARSSCSPSARCRRSRVPMLVGLLTLTAAMIGDHSAPAAPRARAVAAPRRLHLERVARAAYAALADSALCRDAQPRPRAHRGRTTRGDRRHRAGRAAADASCREHSPLLARRAAHDAARTGAARSQRRCSRDRRRLDAARQRGRRRSAYCDLGANVEAIADRSALRQIVSTCSTTR